MKRRELLKNAATTVLGIGSLPAIGFLLESCGVEQTEGYQPLYLSPEQYKTILQIADLIIPATDTPGATDAGVAPYIDLLFAEYFDDQKRAALEEELKQLMESCVRSAGSPFTELDPDEQLSFLESAEQDPSTAAFIRNLKELVLWAFFTSEPGMRSLNYQPVPGKYTCITIDEKEKILTGNQ